MTETAKRQLQYIVDTINQTVVAEAIYLFGSYACGQEQLDSDFDLYVSLHEREIRPIKAVQKISYALARADLPSMDILAGYHQTFLKVAEQNTLEREILEHGVQLYAEKQSDMMNYK